MKRQREFTDHLRDILDAAQKAREFISGVDYSAFCSNNEKIFAVVRALEIIGEAASHIPASIRAKHPVVPWQDAIDMRHKLIHEYFGIDTEVVWETVKEDLPPLQAAVERILQEIERD